MDLNNLKNLDLDITNYELDDILNLFKLNYNFTQSDLKNVYKIVLKTHPDKCNLDKRFFIFFSKLFKILKNVYQLNMKFSESNCPRNTNININNLQNERNEDDNESFQHNTDLHKKLHELNKKINLYNSYKIQNPNKKEKDIPYEKPELLYKKFYKWFKITYNITYDEWFNNNFDKIKKENDDDIGYKEWLESNEDIIDEEEYKDLSPNQKKRYLLNKKREQVKSLIKYDGIKENVSSSIDSSLLTERKPNDYSSSNYTDIKKAYTNTVMDIDESDMENINNYRNMSINDVKIQRHNEMKKFRKVYGTKEYNNKIRVKELEKNKESIYNTYNMVKQMEKGKNMTNQFIASMKLLK